jgi:hypothetical protein
VLLALFSVARHCFWPRHTQLARPFHTLAQAALASACIRRDTALLFVACFVFAKHNPWIAHRLTADVATEAKTRDARLAAALACKARLLIARNVFETEHEQLPFCSVAIEISALCSLFAAFRRVALVFAHRHWFQCTYCARGTADYQTAEGAFEPVARAQAALVVGALPLLTRDRAVIGAAHTHVCRTRVLQRRDEEKEKCALIERK